MDDSLLKEKTMADEEKLKALEKKVSGMHRRILWLEKRAMHLCKQADVNEERLSALEREMFELSVGVNSTEKVFKAFIEAVENNLPLSQPKRLTIYRDNLKTRRPRKKKGKK
jgi:hypothetical protein